MNHLHDLSLLKRVVEEVFQGLMDKYGFSDYDAESKFSTIDISIRSEGLIVRAFLSRTEGIELLFSKTIWGPWRHYGFISFLAKKFNSIGKSEDFLRVFFSEANNYEPYTYDFYKYHLLKEIEFVETYFPKVFKKKSLSMFW